MKLNDCLELGYTSGLFTVGEAYDNVTVHAMSLFTYANMHNEIAELFRDITDKGIDFNSFIKDHIPKKRLQEINKELFETEIPF